MKCSNRSLGWAIMLTAALVPGACGSSTAACEMNSYSDFILGRFDGVSLSRDGRLSIATKLDTVFASDQPVVWVVAQAPDCSLYSATGHHCRIYHIDRA